MGYKCPFCGEVMSETSDTHKVYNTNFSYSEISFMREYPDWYYAQHLYKCPACERISVQIMGVLGEVKGVCIGKYPSSKAKQYPDYVPASIIQDYSEAYLIVDLSPKASATLSRRCLQGMIRDRWKIVKSRLIDEIKELQGKIPAEQWKVIDGVRQLGNIGAHMEKDIDLIVDIDQGEAKKLIQLIELLIEEWYIDRHEQEQLYADITGIVVEKQGIKGGAAINSNP